MTDEPVDPTAFVEDAQEKLRALAVNITRVVRGAGEPADLFTQSAHFAVAMRDGLAAGHRVPSSIITDAIKLPNLPGDEFERAIDRIISASLRIAAARLAGSSLQASKGQNDLFEAINTIEAVRAANRKAFQ